MLAIGFLISVAFAAAAPKQDAAKSDDRPRVVRCAIDGADGPIYRGRCEYHSERGFFALSPVGKDRFSADLIDVKVEIERPGHGDVRGLTTSGVNSRWGAATRSRKDRACWIGSDFRICAWR